MKLIFAQGNPGNEFKRTRHNVGFLAIGFFAEKQSVAFQPKSKFHAEIAETTSGGEKILLVKPTTFYNETGVSARSIVDFYKIQSQDILVIHDELMLPFGKIRVRHSGRDAGNNGIKSLNSHLGEQFARIRIGVQNELREKMNDTDFVLGTFSTDEQKVLGALILPETVSLIERFLLGSLVDESISLVH